MAGSVADLITEEGRQHNGCAYDEEDGTDECHDVLGNTVFTSLHLEIDLELREFETVDKTAGGVVSTLFLKA